MIIGEGFGARVIEALLTVLAEDARFRDLPVAVVGEHSAVGEHFAAALPNLERIADGPTRVIEHLLPYIRVHAFARRLKRMLTSLDAKGAIDPDTGLLANTISGAISTAPSMTPTSAAPPCRLRDFRCPPPTAAPASKRRGSWAS